jgi:hypothetical protein
MKVNDLQRQLDEGFLDNLISRVQSMAGGDGPTGIIRAMRGSNAALRKFADAIANTTRPRVMQRVGNQLAQINDGSVPMPVKMIYQQALAAADKIAATDQTEIEPALPQVKPTIKSNRADIERLVMSSNVGDNNEIKLLLDTILGGTGTASISMDVESAIAAVSMIVAATVIFIQTQQEDIGATEVDENALEEFKAAGVALDKLLFSQDSPDLKTLNPNKELADNLEELVSINMVMGQNGIQKKYLNLTTEQAQAALASPPKLVNPQALTRLLSSHAQGIDPAAVSAVVAKAEPLIQAQFTAWLKIAVTEQPPRAKSFEIYKEWARDTLTTIERMNFEQPAEPAAAAQAENNPEFKALEDAHVAGEEAVKQALAANPGLSGPEMKRIYDAAREAYDKTK